MFVLKACFKIYTNFPDAFFRKIVISFNLKVFQICNWYLKVFECAMLVYENLKATLSIYSNMFAAKQNLPRVPIENSNEYQLWSNLYQQD